MLQLTYFATSSGMSTPSYSFSLIFRVVNLDLPVVLFKLLLSFDLQFAYFARACGVSFFFCLQKCKARICSRSSSIVSPV